MLQTFAVIRDFEVKPKLHSIDELIFVIVDHVIPAVPVQRNAHHPKEALESVVWAGEFEEMSLLR